MKKSKIKSTKQLIEALEVSANGDYTISVWSKLFKQKVEVEFYAGLAIYQLILVIIPLIVLI